MKAKAPAYTYTIVDYSALVDQTPQAIRWQIKEGKLPTGVTAKKVGTTWLLYCDEVPKPKEKAKP